MFETKVVEKIETRFGFSIVFSENHIVYVIMWKNIVEPGRPEVTIWRMRFACWITKATNTYSEYVLLLFQGSSGYKNAPKYCVIPTYIACLWLLTAWLMSITECHPSSCMQLCHSPWQCPLVRHALFWIQLEFLARPSQSYAPCV